VSRSLQQASRRPVCPLPMTEDYIDKSPALSMPVRKTAAGFNRLELLRQTRPSNGQRRGVSTPIDSSNIGPPTPPR